ncbi:MAG: hypothetical protein K8S54_03450 [Spirochaetia bacterium]|nr:hypothetical protein [Spirochaetia bacterium]
MTKLWSIPLLLLCTGLLAREQLILSTGETISGTIKADKENVILIEVEGEIRTIDKSEILRIKLQDKRQIIRRNLVFAEVLLGRGVPTSVGFHSYGNPILADFSWFNFVSPNAARRELATMEFLDSTATPRALSNNVVARLGFGLSDTLELGLMGTQTNAAITDFRSGLDSSSSRLYVLSKLQNFPNLVRSDVPNSFDYAYLPRRKKRIKLSSASGMDLKIHVIHGPIDPYLSLGLFNHGASAALGLRYFIFNGSYLSGEVFSENLRSELPRLQFLPFGTDRTTKLVTNSGWRIGFGQAIDLNL